MKHLKAIQEASSATWAILPSSLRAIIEGLAEGFTADDYSKFHAVAQEERAEIKAALGSPVDGSFYSYISGDTGVLLVDGPVIPRATALSDVSGVMSLERLTAEHAALDAMHGVKNIVTVIDSPGGVVNGIEEYQAVVRGSRANTIAYASGMAASLGYWIASASSKIVAPSTGVVGSVGTIITIPDRGKEKALTFVSSQSPLKRDVSSPEGQEAIQQLVNDQADTFIQAVATNRKVEADHVLSNFGRGALMVAKRALEVGMIDQIGLLSDVIPTSNSKTVGATVRTVAAEENNKPLPLEVETMAEEHKAEVVEAVEPSIDVEAQIAAATAEAVEKERKRIMDIDALLENFAGSHPDAIAAAKAVIDVRKWEPEATADKVALEAFKAATAGQAKAHDQYAEGARAAADLAGHAAKAVPAEDSAEAKERNNKERAEGIAKHLK